MQTSLVSLVVAIVFAIAPAAERYVSATIDPSGQLRIVTSSRRTISPEKTGDQVGFSAPRISPDGHTVGWLAEFPNCCTSYPIPLKLVLYRAGRTQEFTGSGLPVWHWAFLAGGTHIAFEQETVHGGIGIHYELRDTASGRLIDEYNPTSDPDMDPGVVPKEAPKWVHDLDDTPR